MLFKVKYLGHLFLLKHSNGLLICQVLFLNETYFLVMQAMRKQPRHINFWFFVHVYKL